VRKLGRKLPILLLIILVGLIPALGIGCQDTAVVSVVPTADFGLDNDHPLVGEQIHFTDRSQGNPTAWYWDFGDSKTSDQESPTHTYTETDVYSVTLKVSNSAGSDAKVWTSLVTVTW